MWAVMISTYNCAQDIKTLTRVLGETPGADTVRIEVVDGFSTQDDC